MNNTNFLTESLPAAQATGTIEPPQSPPEQRPHAKPIVYACSGCSDAGELADRIARQLTRAGVAEMSCLAGIGGRVKSIVGRGEKAERILVIDGCPLNCARKTLELPASRNSITSDCTKSVCARAIVP